MHGSVPNLVDTMMMLHTHSSTLELTPPEFSILAVNRPNATPAMPPMTPDRMVFTTQLFMASSCMICSIDGIVIGLSFVLGPANVVPGPGEGADVLGPATDGAASLLLGCASDMMAAPLLTR